jgi:hypothetical protein
VSVGQVSRISFRIWVHAQKENPFIDLITMLDTVPRTAFGPAPKNKPVIDVRLLEAVS